jgi:hypothetical protein
VREGLAVVEALLVPDADCVGEAVCVAAALRVREPDGALEEEDVCVASAVEEDVRVASAVDEDVCVDAADFDADPLKLRVPVCELVCEAAALIVALELRVCVLTLVPEEVGVTEDDAPLLCVLDTLGCRLLVRLAVPEALLVWLLLQLAESEPLALRVGDGECVEAAEELTVGDADTDAAAD